MRRTATALFLTAVVASAVSGCSTARETEPPRSASEELLISAAADRAADKLKTEFPPGTKVFVDPQFFQGIDARYTIGAIRDRLLRDGAHLVPDRKNVDTIIEIRSGAQSINDESTLVGIPSFDIPIPLAGAFKFPEIAFYKEDEKIGVSKISMTGYGAKDGDLPMTLGPEYGFSHRKKWIVLLFISWTEDDSIPKNADDGNVIDLPNALPGEH